MRWQGDGPMTDGRHGVGLIGAGMVTQAIHIPVLVSLADRFRIAQVMDADLGLAARVASSVGASASGTVAALLGDPAVDVVAICSPDRFHAEQIESACLAGKRLIMCEKPLVLDVDEATRVAEACRLSGTVLVVGTMHAFDPGYVAAFGAWSAEGRPADLVRSTIYLPPNDDVIRMATEAISASAEGPTVPSAPSLSIRRTVLSLAIHDLPLVRAIVPDAGDVRFARLIPPFGYALRFGEGTAVEMLAYMGGSWAPAWTFEAFGPVGALRVEFPPSYVLAGSAQAAVTTSEGLQAWSFERNGYQAEWDEVADILDGRRVAPPVDTPISDARYALAIADGAERLLASDVGSSPS
jgi:myo-inositol 2-dehydrogenase / D-chiro-inositol 1-dehydrogenase